MLIEVKQWPESQEVMENSDWFFLMAPRTDDESNPIGDSAYGRILDEDEYMLTKDIQEKYTFSEYVNLYSSCGMCGGKGYLTDVYDTEAEETQIQRCDSCKQFESDKQAREHVESEVE